MSTSLRKLHYYLIADASGSMANQIDEVRQALNTQLRKLRSLAATHDTTVRFSLLTFDSEMRWRYRNCPLNKVQPIMRDDYDTGGATALFDAIAAGLKDASKNVFPHFDAACDSVQFSVYSDGEENSSRHTKVEQLKELLDHYQRLPGWTIEYFGCDPESFEQLRGAGFHVNAMHAYDAQYRYRVFEEDMQMSLEAQFTEPPKDFLKKNDKRKL